MILELKWLCSTFPRNICKKIHATLNAVQQCNSATLNIAAVDEAKCKRVKEMASLNAIGHIRLNGCALTLRIFANQPFFPDKPDTLLDLFQAFRSRVVDTTNAPPSPPQGASTRCVSNSWTWFC